MSASSGRASWSLWCFCWPGGICAKHFHATRRASQHVKLEMLDPELESFLTKAGQVGGAKPPFKDSPNGSDATKCSGQRRESSRFDILNREAFQKHFLLKSVPATEYKAAGCWSNSILVARNTTCQLSNMFHGKTLKTQFACRLFALKCQRRMWLPEQGQGVMGSNTVKLKNCACYHAEPFPK